jgi:hypothetical protein
VRRKKYSTGEEVFNFQDVAPGVVINNQKVSLPTRVSSRPTEGPSDDLVPGIFISPNW